MIGKILMESGSVVKKEPSSEVLDGSLDNNVLEAGLDLPSSSEYQPSLTPLSDLDFHRPGVALGAPKEMDRISKSLDPTSKTSEEAYLKYAPGTDPDRKGKVNYDSFLDQLGFKAKGLRAIRMRSRLLDDLKIHMDNQKYSFRVDKPENLREMVLRFLRVHGTKYWGKSPRQHLSEPDKTKGFLMPRDADRVNSRLVFVLERVFAYKARCSKSGDRPKPTEDRIIPNLDNYSLIQPSNGSAKSNTKKRANPDDYLHNLQLQDPVSSDDEPLISGNRSNNPSIGDKSQESLATRGRDLQKIHHATLETALSSVELPASTGDRGLEALPRKRPRFINKQPANQSTAGATKSTKTETVIENRVANSAENGSTISLQKLQQPVINPFGSQTQPQEDDALVMFYHSPFPSTIKREYPLTPAVDCRWDMPVHILAGTRLIVSASNQPDLAPANIRFPVCGDINSLFAKLSYECDLGREMVNKISNISATYTWSGDQQRLRKGKEEDFDLFREILRTAWERNATRFGDGCKINMLLHVNK